jgi:hypothetical protein
MAASDRERRRRAVAADHEGAGTAPTAEQKRSPRRHPDAATSPLETHQRYRVARGMQRDTATAPSPDLRLPLTFRAEPCIRATAPSSAFSPKRPRRLPSRAMRFAAGIDGHRRILYGAATDLISSPERRRHGRDPLRSARQVPHRARPAPPRARGPACGVGRCLFAGSGSRCAETAQTQEALPAQVRRQGLRPERLPRHVRPGVRPGRVLPQRAVRGVPQFHRLPGRSYGLHDVCVQCGGSLHRHAGGQRYRVWRRQSVPGWGVRRTAGVCGPQRLL